jgi:hypothetical protein
MGESLAFIYRELAREGCQVSGVNVRDDAARCLSSGDDGLNRLPCPASLTRMQLQACESSLDFAEEAWQVLAIHRIVRRFTGKGRLVLHASRARRPAWLNKSRRDREALRSADRRVVAFAWPDCFRVDPMNLQRPRSIGGGIFTFFFNY